MMNRGAVLFVSFLLVILALWLVWAGFRPLDRDDARIQQALIAGSFLAAGWLLTFFLRELSAHLAEVEKSEDLQETLRAEIFDYSYSLDDDLEAAVTELELAVAAGEAAGTPYHPYFPRVSEPVIFNALVGDIYLLPAKVTDHVVQFYAQLSDIRLMVEDLQSEAYRGLNATRRLQGYRDYLDIRATGAELAQDAVDALNASLGALKEARLANPPTVTEADRQKMKELKQDLSSRSAGLGDR